MRVKTMEVIVCVGFGSAFSKAHQNLTKTKYIYSKHKMIKYTYK